MIDNPQTGACVGMIGSWYSFAQTEESSLKESVYLCLILWNVMHELRVQVNHLYDLPYRPQIRRVRNVMNVLYPKSQHIYPLQKFQVPQFDCLSVAFSSIEANPDFCKLPNSSSRGFLIFLKAWFLRTSASINVYIYVNYF